MFLWDQSSRTILTFIIGSTVEKHWFTEIQNGCGLSPSVIASTLKRLTDAEILIREAERYVGESDFRAPRVYYSISPVVIDYLRL
jgi:DNA-binding HxlR family transcriptional regulator